MLKINKKPRIVTVSKSNLDIANGSTLWDSINAPSGAVAVTGYYVSGSGNIKTQLYAFRFVEESSLCSFALYNWSGAAVSLTMYVDFLVLD